MVLISLPIFGPARRRKSARWRQPCAAALARPRDIC
jgi:hypothetical protein